MTNSRDIGLRGVGAGKGDAPRTKLDESYRAKFDEIKMSHVLIEDDPSFKRVGPGRWRKVFK